MRSTVLVLLALLVVSPASRQGSGGDAADGPDAVAGVGWLYETVKGYLMASAEQASPELYDYRPTDEVRSFGQIIGHVANAQYAFCSGALQEESPSGRNLEELSSKAELVGALRESFEYCDRAYAMDEAAALETVQLFTRERTRLFALEFNMGHDFEHYGNLVTYMRSNGMVPPSSQGN
ncbi:MAG: DinB family protein [Gemmatimonadetes bacterium]|nr:DinB family protein [Gemmatimonadota bacterium]NIR78176.1 DinB family protein [Gemmatimonadota bacterium]NIT86746.1 DinB family protein [Gemmatimonadota bacterium]NIU30607.1 DinB family protein [Gemmatimonadota bacterium]NIU35422.1 DinB family protein [Gemmatimonadota bacterium]